MRRLGCEQFARRFHGYPEDFFGFVDLPLGCVSVVCTSRPEVLFVGEHWDEQLAVKLGKLLGGA